MNYSSDGGVDVLCWCPSGRSAARACLLNSSDTTCHRGDMSSNRFQQFTDSQWALIAPMLPSSDGRQGRPFRNSRRVVEGIIYRYRTGIAWRDLPEYFGPWQTVWKRQRRYAADGTWDAVLGRILTEADAAGEVDWTVSVDATINRAHQHATNTTRPEQHTGGAGELHEAGLSAD